MAKGKSRKYKNDQQNIHIKLVFYAQLRERKHNE
jgi:hypothetical protein